MVGIPSSVQTVIPEAVCIGGLPEGQTLNSSSWSGYRWLPGSSFSLAPLMQSTFHLFGKVLRRRLWQGALRSESPMQHKGLQQCERVQLALTCPRPGQAPRLVGGISVHTSASASYF